MATKPVFIVEMKIAHNDDSDQFLKYNETLASTNWLPRACDQTKEVLLSLKNEFITYTEVKMLTYEITSSSLSANLCALSSLVKPFST